MRITYENVWASEGGLPSELTPAQINLGWVQNEFPPFEIVNYLQNKTENTLKYLLRVGVSEWSPSDVYEAGNLVYHEGLHYKATQEVFNVTPNSGSGRDFWIPAWDEYGSAQAVSEQIEQAKTVEGFWGLYVSKANPVMTGKASAPAFKASVGTGNLNRGYLFDRTLATGLQAMDDGSLALVVDGVMNGRVKKTPPTLEMNDDTLVTTKLLNEVIANVKKTTEIPVGWSVITQNSKPPSDASQLGYGTWVQDCQGRAIVGVSSKTSDPTWTKAVNTLYGAFKVALSILEMPNHNHPLNISRWKHGKDGRRGSTATWSDGDVTDTNTRMPDDAETVIGSVGGGEAHENVQPSQVKYIWTRTA